MKHLLFFIFFYSSSYGQFIEVIDPVTQQLMKVHVESIDLPKNSASKVINECNKRIEENPQDWKAYHQRARSKQILMDLKGSIEDINVLIENEQLLNFAYWMKAESYIYMLDYSNAIENYKKAINYYHEPYTKARINFIIGMCYIQIDNEEQGCIYFKKMGDLRSHSGFEQAKKYCLK